MPPPTRYPDAGALATDLKAFKSGARIAARRYTLFALLAHWIRRHRALALSVTTAIALATAGIVVFVRNIAAERDRADTALARAEAANGELTLERAALLLHTDPTAAVAALADYRGDDAVRRRRLVAEARGRGVARAVHTPHSDTVHFLLGDRTGAIVSVGEDRRIQLTQGTSSTTLASDVSTSVRVTYAPSRRLLAYAASPAGIAVLDLGARTTKRISTLAGGRDVAEPTTWPTSAGGTGAPPQEARYRPAWLAWSDRIRTRKMTLPYFLKGSHLLSLRTSLSWSHLVAIFAGAIEGTTPTSYPMASRAAPITQPARSSRCSPSRGRSLTPSSTETATSRTCSTGEQVGGYLRVLGERFQLIERRQPVFAKPSAKRGRYYLTDNFLRAWLAALANPISAINFVPVARLIEQADDRLAEVEGHSLEKLIGLLYEERSRKGLGDFALSERIQGFWDRANTEIDRVAMDAVDKRIRFGSCKRNADRLAADLPVLDGHVQRFLAVHPRFSTWTVEKVGIAPTITAEVRARLNAARHLAQDLADLTAEFH